MVRIIFGLFDLGQFFCVKDISEVISFVVKSFGVFLPTGVALFAIYFNNKKTQELFHKEFVNNQYLKIYEILLDITKEKEMLYYTLPAYEYDILNDKAKKDIVKEEGKRAISEFYKSYKRMTMKIEFLDVHNEIKDGVSNLELRESRVLKEFENNCDNFAASKNETNLEFENYQKHYQLEIDKDLGEISNNLKKLISRNNK